MTPIADLTGSHLRTYTTLFQHPVSHNLEWRAVRSLLDQLADVAEQPNGHLRVTRNGESLVLPAPTSKDVASTEELMTLRHFLQRSEEPGTPDLTSGLAPDWLLVINHHEARVYRSEASGAAAEQVRPHAPEDYFRHAPHSENFSRGQEKPDPQSFFAPVAKVLGDAGRILIFGSGTGMSSEMEQFLTWSKAHLAPLAARIVGTVTIDEHHLTEAQVLAKARDFYRTLAVTGV